MSWTGNNRSVNEMTRKVLFVELQGQRAMHENKQKFSIAVVSNPQTWRWEPEIRELSGLIDAPDDIDRSARMPHRAAAQALEYVLGLADRNELPT